MSSRSVVVTLNPVGKELSGHSYAPVILGLAGDSDFGPNQSSGGWQIVDRPKSTAATQWYDRSIFKLVFKGILDKSILNVNSTGASVEDDCRQLEKWLDKVPTTQEPPKLAIDGPIPGINRLWVLFDVQFHEALRNVDSSTQAGYGYRYQQHVDITLYEYVPPTSSSSLNNLLVSSATAFQATQSASGELQPQMSVYVIQKGDTLIRICNKVAGKATSDFLALVRSINGLRDDSMIPNMIGQVLQIPRGS